MSGSDASNLTKAAVNNTAFFNTSSKNIIEKVQQNSKQFNDELLKTLGEILSDQNDPQPVQKFLSAILLLQLTELKNEQFIDRLAVAKVLLNQIFMLAQTDYKKDFKERGINLFYARTNKIDDKMIGNNLINLILELLSYWSQAYGVNDKNSRRYVFYGMADKLKAKTGFQSEYFLVGKDFTVDDEFLVKPIFHSVCFSDRVNNEKREAIDADQILVESNVLPEETVHKSGKVLKTANNDEAAQEKANAEPVKDSTEVQEPKETNPAENQNKEEPSKAEKRTIKEVPLEIIKPEEKQPAVEEKIPIEEKKPVPEESKPKQEEPKLKVEEPKPKVEDPKPKVEEHLPKVEEPKPKVEETKPKVEEPKPKVEEQKPKSEEPKPKVEEPKPKVEEPKPKKEEPKPVEPKQTAAENSNPAISSANGKPKTGNAEPQEKKAPVQEKSAPTTDNRLSSPPAKVADLADENEGSPSIQDRSRKFKSAAFASITIERLKSPQKLNKIEDEIQKIHNRMLTSSQLKSSMKKEDIEKNLEKFSLEKTRIVSFYEERIKKLEEENKQLRQENKKLVEELNNKPAPVPVSAQKTVVKSEPEFVHTSPRLATQPEFYESNEEPLVFKTHRPQLKASESNSSQVAHSEGKVITGSTKNSGRKKKASDFGSPSHYGDDAFKITPIFPTGETVLKSEGQVISKNKSPVRNLKDKKTINDDKFVLKSQTGSFAYDGSASAREDSYNNIRLPSRTIGASIAGLMYSPQSEFRPYEEFRSKNI